MAKTKVNAKKEIQAYILATLEKSLDKVKEGMSDKKFKRSIKKASKLIAEDFKVVKPKAAKKVKAAKATKAATAAAE